MENQVILKKLNESDFKGQTRELFFNPKETVITGRNGVGKTSVLRAFSWLLTGKTDASGKVNSELFDNTKELSPATPPAIVSAVIEIDGKEHELRRTAVAKFTRPKGSVEYVKASSDDYRFQIDGMPYTATDFGAWVEYNIAPLSALPVMLMGETFALACENDRMKARKMLTDVVGEKTPDMGKYAEIAKELEDAGSVEVLLLKYREIIRTCNSDLDRIPTEIQVNRMKSEEIRGAVDAETNAEPELKSLDAEIQRLTSAIEKKNVEANEANKEARSILERKNQLLATINQRHLNESKEQSYIDALKSEEVELQKRLETKCPNCGYVLNQDPNTAARLAEVQKLFVERTQNLQQSKMETAKIESEHNKLFVPQVFEVNTQAEQEAIAVANQKKSELLSKVSADGARKAELKACETAIETLQNQQREAGMLLAATERKKMLVDKYQQECAELLSADINNRMTNTKIQMFEIQKNGERKPSCVITNAQGVKYSTLNFSARILANIEISKLFCSIYGVSVPRFVDECSVFDSYNMPKCEDAQMIYIRCSDDQNLTVL